MFLESPAQNTSFHTVVGEQFREYSSGSQIMELDFGCFNLKMEIRKITAIRPQKRNPDRLNIELDGEFAFGLSRIVAAWLNVGDGLSETRISELLDSDTSEVAYQKALHLLDYRPRTAKEIQLRLAEKGFSEEEIDRVVLRLKNARLVEDHHFARQWVENRNEFHPRSQRLIRYELRNKGVDEQLIDSALAESIDDTELAMRAAIKYARKLNSDDRLIFKKKLSAYLGRRGFSYGTIAPVVQSLLNARISSQSDTMDNEDENNGKY